MGISVKMAKHGDLAFVATALFSAVVDRTEYEYRQNRMELKDKTGQNGYGLFFVDFPHASLSN